jgi:hypothetical protein
MAMLRRGYISKKSYHFLTSAGRFAQLFSTMLSYDSFAAYIVDWPLSRESVQSALCADADSISNAGGA